MLELSLSKLVLIGMVALVVLGPEKLPVFARSAGKLYRRLHQYMSDVRSDISRQFDMEELRNIEKSVRQAAQDIESQINQQIALPKDAGKPASAERLDGDYEGVRPLLPADASIGKARQFRLAKMGKKPQRHIRRSHSGRPAPRERVSP